MYAHLDPEYQLDLILERNFLEDRNCSLCLKIQ